MLVGIRGKRRIGTDGDCSSPQSQHKEEPMNNIISTLINAKWYDLNMGCSIFTPPWPGDKALEIHFFKRVTGAYGGGAGAEMQMNH